MTKEFDGEKFITGREGGDYYSGFYVDWLEEKIATLEQKVEGLEEIQKASIEFYCGVIDKAAWRIAVRNSPKGQELMALAATSDTFT